MCVIGMAGVELTVNLVRGTWFCFWSFRSWSRTLCLTAIRPLAFVVVSQNDFLLLSLKFLSSSLFYQSGYYQRNRTSEGCMHGWKG